MKADLAERIMQFQTLSLPGQMPMMHMGTSYLVNDLASEVKAQERLIETLTAALEEIRDMPIMDPVTIYEIARTALSQAKRIEP